MFLIAYIFYLFVIVSLAATLYFIERLASTKKEVYLLLALIVFLSIYQNALIVTYQLTHLPVAVKLLQYLKDVIVFGVPLVYVFGHKNIFTKGFRLHILDYLFLIFGSLAFLYVFLPLGDATIVNKVIYFKNMLLWMLLYLIGRNSKMDFREVKVILIMILLLGVVALFFNTAEKLSGQHLQSQIGFASYAVDILDYVPEGHYGLTWTFEATDGTKRFASIYANPLEFAASMLLMFAVAIVLTRYTPYVLNGGVYLSLAIIAGLNVLGAYSRASLVGFVGVIFFAALLLRYYRLIISGIVLVVMAVVYILYFAPKERLDFVYETLTFEHGSSLGHAIEWLEGIESMIQSPMGIGLAMSGNAGGVDDDVKVGGENQFIIYGVQLGVFGLILYTSMVILSIWYCFRAFRNARDPSEAVVPFVASTVKFGLLIPLFTSNAEIYLYTALVSWWMVGFSISQSRTKDVK